MINASLRALKAPKRHCEAPFLGAEAISQKCLSVRSFVAAGPPLLRINSRAGLDVRRLLRGGSVSPALI